MKREKDCFKCFINYNNHCLVFIRKDSEEDVENSVYLEYNGEGTDLAMMLHPEFMALLKIWDNFSQVLTGDRYLISKQGQVSQWYPGMGDWGIPGY